MFVALRLYVVDGWPLTVDPVLPRVLGGACPGLEGSPKTEGSKNRRSDDGDVGTYRSRTRSARGVTIPALLPPLWKP